MSGCSFPRGFGGGGSGLGEVAGGWRRGAGGHRPARDRGLAWRSVPPSAEGLGASGASRPEAAVHGQVGKQQSLGCSAQRRGKLAFWVRPWRRWCPPRLFWQEGLSLGHCQTKLLWCAGSCPPVLPRVVCVTFPNRAGWGWGAWQVNLVEGRETCGKACLILLCRGGAYPHCHPPAGCSSFLSRAPDNTSFSVEDSLNIRGPSWWYHNVTGGESQSRSQQDALQSATALYWMDRINPTLVKTDGFCLDPKCQSHSIGVRCLTILWCWVYGFPSGTESRKNASRGEFTLKLDDSLYSWHVFPCRWLVTSGRQFVALIEANVYTGLGGSVASQGRDIAHLSQTLARLCCMLFHS